MYNFNNLRSIEECRTVAMRAKQGNRMDVYHPVLNRMAQIAASDPDFLFGDPNDPVEQDFAAGLAIYEQLLYESGGRKGKVARRSRQAAEEKGSIKALTDWV